MTRRTVVPGCSQREGGLECEVLLLRRQQINVLELMSTGRKSLRIERTLIMHGSVTTAFNSTVSTKGSRSAMSLMHE